MCLLLLRNGEVRSNNLGNTHNYHRALEYSQFHLITEAFHILNIFMVQTNGLLDTKINLSQCSNPAKGKFLCLSNHYVMKIYTGIRLQLHESWPRQ
jgi:hypothetical protein